MKSKSICNSLFFVTLLTLMLLFPVNSMAAGKSPFPAPDETDSSFVTDTAPKLDSYLYVNSSPILFDIEIKRYVGVTNSDGTLKDYQQLISNKVISATADIRMPVYDVDDDYSGSYYVKEIDKIYINGHYMGLLSGGNGNWKQNSFTIPIEWLKFPTKGINGNAPTPEKNEIRIDIDTGNNGTRVWAVEIDWAELAFEAMPPVILIHGNSSDAGFWDRQEFTQILGNMKIPYDNTINLPTTTVANNGITLKNEILSVANGMGVQNIQLIAHSKGGLDTREFLSTHYPALKQNNQLKIHTFITLSTPHRGSAGADYIRALELLSNSRLENPNARTELAEYLSDSYNQNQYNANLNLTTSWTKNFNTRNHLPGDIQYYSVGADADVDNNGTLERNEYQEILDEAEHPNVWDWYVNGRMNTMYDTLGNFSSVTIQYTGRNTGWPRYTPIYELVENPTSSFQENDMLVTVNSARYTFTFIGQFDKNHSSVADDEVAQGVVGYLKYR